MRKGLFLAVAAVFLITLTFTAREASAVPAFARQTGMACNSCHFQSFPSLNAFGRAFKSGGYTQVGGESLIEGDFLSIPAVLNASLITKIRYQNANGTAETGDAGEVNKGQVQFPDEAALLIGGRAGEHVGFLLESSLKDGDSRFTSYKMPVVFDVMGAKASVIPFSTDAAGAAYGFELLNTGALRMARPVEHRKETSAQQYIGTDGAATGVALVAAHSMGFANYSAWAPVHGTNDAGPYLHYLRLAATPTVSGWDVGVGAQWWGGTTKYGAPATPTRESADAYALDAQAQGTVGDYPLGVYVTYASAKKSDSGTSNLFNSSTRKDKSAWTVTGDLGVIPNKLSAIAAYRGGKNGDPNNNGKDSDNASTLGLSYNPTQNMNLQLLHSWYTGNANENTSSGDKLLTLMLFAAF